MNIAFIIYLIANLLLGAVTTRIPSEDNFETTSSSLASDGSVYFLENILDTIVLPSFAFSSCLPSTVTTPLSTLTFSSSGLYCEVSTLTSILVSSSLVLKLSKPLEFSAGDIQPIPHTGCCVLRRLSHILRPARPCPEILIKPLPHIPGLRKHAFSHLVKVFPGVLEESVIRNKIPE